LMKKLLSFFLLFITITVHGQIIHPGKWKFTIVQQKNKGEVELVFSLKLEKHWHTYPPSNPDGGSLPMVFEFEKSDCYSLAGKIIEPKPIIEFDSIFGVYQH